jgi:Transposase
VTAAFSDYSSSFTEAIKAVFPHARFQADHFHTVHKAPCGRTRRGDICGPVHVPI